LDIWGRSEENLGKYNGKIPEFSINRTLLRCHHSPSLFKDQPHVIKTYASFPRESCWVAIEKSLMFHKLHFMAIAVVHRFNLTNDVRVFQNTSMFERLSLMTIDIADLLAINYMS